MTAPKVAAPKHWHRPLPEIRTHWGTGVVSSPEADWAARVLAQVAEFGQLAKGWDGEDSPSVGLEVVEVARRIVLQAAAHEEMPRPHVAPVPGGGIQVEWYVDDVELELEVLPSRDISFIRKVAGVEDDGLIQVERGRIVDELIRCLIR